MGYFAKWTPKLAQKRSLSRLDKIENMLIVISGQYGDIHQGICSRVDDLLAELNGFRAEIKEATQEIIESDMWR